ncbi:UDP-N-acetylmuramoylalanyl-D-glutamate--2,6-diaminopimelate ligase [Streptomyces sp. WMMB 714]|uniref:UDP-N-acetylmuramoyl-L-alanyl-D-glutamate--2, 6-diaminopimelate ligase n=1 Tax=Streptomyces sp. WMMB 714 TaxID=1286822 RepID=UPI0005F85CEF|nr:UDP-N-acetylmuramoyl-L-alanyl-D-glutamate--2,6-diaminopimelate ligase [Streptomyces sp. WMMB 714]SCK28219.1 UDP-N-acetylmuramoylalanyl-D-glutamate--2,6-diaminopimelate ligase [Streptomyces sp. WMMB 714]
MGTDAQNQHDGPDAVPPGSPSLRGTPSAPGTLTAVPQADQNSLSPSAGGRAVAPTPEPAPKPATDVSSGPPRPAHVRPVPLAELALQLRTDAPAGTEEAAATGITHDSRAVRPGDVYAALPGARFHGADFASQAASLGAVAVLTDPAGTERSAATGLPVLTVPDPRGRMGALAAAIYGEPGKDLLQIGITGTSGKTTTAYLVEGGLRKAAEKAGELTGLIGTVESRIGDERLKSERTTPEATDLQALFAVMRERGVTSVAMEVSSHALVLGRVDGSVFDVAVFNNLSPEHLDFHPDMEDYFRAKRQLFTRARSRAGVVNFDDEYGQRLLTESEVPVTTFSAEGHPDADWRAEDVQVGPLGSTFTAVGPKDESVRAAAPIAGPFNVANALAALTALVVAGIDPQTAADGIASVPGVPGRLERVDAGQDYLAIVDYAHKPDAVESVLYAMRKVTDGRVHAVLGCGGDRDPHKRPAMGSALARLADTAVLTSDNPRSEDPLAILATMLAGAAEVPAYERGTVLMEEDRGAAIRLAVARAEPGDTVLVLGKGHELGQDIAGVVRPFDDIAVLREAIRLKQEEAGAAAAAAMPPRTPTNGTDA